MKKLLAILLALVMVLSLVACAGEKTPVEEAPVEEAPVEEAPVEEAPVEEAPVEEAPVEEVAVMTYADFVAAELDSQVVVETYVQTIESWWDGACHIYAQSEDGAYYIYQYACTEEEAAKLVPGTKIRVTGYKGEWSGEVEIMDPTVEILEGSFLATPTDVTEAATTGADALAANMNALVAINGMTVAPSKDAEGNDVAFLYKWDGSGSKGDDIYFNVTIGEQTYTFTINAYMVGYGADSEVYAAAEALQIGDTINVEGFMYWYEGPQAHITSINLAG